MPPDEYLCGTQRLFEVGTEVSIPVRLAPPRYRDGLFGSHVAPSFPILRGRIALRALVCAYPFGSEAAVPLTLFLLFDEPLFLQLLEGSGDTRFAQPE
jgi:hypothetical protein